MFAAAMKSFLDPHETNLKQNRRSVLDHDAITQNRIAISSLCLSMILFGKPVSTFPDHALGDGGQWSSIDARGKIHADDRGSDQSSKPPRWIAARDKHVAACPDDADSREAH
ncbi:MAG: hypothetical protein WA702_24200 [Bradyrhizobium sp.]|uniref:hypothetical protein n=1 Tax=Bradyrhizobium sp. TaxID=376 RepID=UPI003C7ADA9F